MMQYKRSYFEETLMIRDYAFDINEYNYYKYIYQVTYQRQGVISHAPTTRNKCLENVIRFLRCIFLFLLLPQ